jgi:hypothetical protein
MSKGYRNLILYFLQHFENENNIVYPQNQRQKWQCYEA